MGSPLLSFLGNTDEEVDKSLTVVETAISKIRAHVELTAKDIFGE
jgi:hypothetical protein